MTTIQVVVLALIILGVLVSPKLVYMWSYMSARGRWKGIHDAKMQTSINNLLNLKKYVKEAK